MTLEFKLRYVTVLITLNRSRSVDVRFLAASQIPWIKVGVRSYFLPVTADFISLLIRDLRYL